MLGYPTCPLMNVFDISQAVSLRPFVLCFSLMCLAAAVAGSAVSDAFAQQVEIENSAPSLVEVPDGYFSALGQELRKDWPNNRRVHIVFHGHSVPAGYFKTPQVRTFDSYPHLTHVFLSEAFPTATIDVSVTAIGGENSESGAKRFQEDVCKTRPDVVAIDYGLNDRRIGLQRARVAWQSMIDQAKEAGAKVILLTPTADVSEDVLEPETPLAKHRRLIRELAKENQVALVDSYAAFGEKIRSGLELEKLMSQSNHPNSAGHQVVAEQLKAAFLSGMQETAGE